MSTKKTLEELSLLVVLLAASSWLGAAVLKEVANSYVQTYENKAIFLKVPIQGQRQLVHVRRNRPSLGAGTGSLLFKVGEQVRITDVGFRGDSVRFKITSVDARTQAEIIFQFPQPLVTDFPQRAAFDAALAATLTEGLSYAEIDTAKEQFIEAEFGRFLGRLARASDTSQDFVRKALTRNMPDYESLTNETDVVRTELEDVQRVLDREKTARQKAETELNRSRREQGELRSERDNLSERLKSLQREMELLKKSSQSHERQIKELVQSLNVKDSSSETLGNQVQILRESVESLGQQRMEASRKLGDANRELLDLRGQNERLSGELSEVSDERESLWGDFRTLTSNRKGLEARYMDLKREKETLQTRELLEDSLTLEKRLETREEGTLQLADLYLLSRKIATFEVQIPRFPGNVYTVRFAAQSPDTVKFSKEERELYEALGDQFRIGTEWQSGSGRLKMLLLNQEPLQTVGARESAHWPWLFQGELTEPEGVSLVVYMLDSEGQKIILGSQDFTLQPGQMVARFRQSFSVVSMAAGAALGMLVFGFVFGFGRRSRPVEKSAPRSRPRNVVVQKKL